jgi:hypothetical protein
MSGEPAGNKRHLVMSGELAGYKRQLVMYGEKMSFVTCRFP